MQKDWISRLPRQNLIQEMEPFRRCMRIFRFVICIIHRRKRKKNKSRLKVQSKMGAVSLNALQKSFPGSDSRRWLFYNCKNTQNKSTYFAKSHKIIKRTHNLLTFRGGMWYTLYNSCQMKQKKERCVCLKRGICRIWKQRCLQDTGDFTCRYSRCRSKAAVLYHASGAEQRTDVVSAHGQYKGSDSTGNDKRRSQPSDSRHSFH